MCPNCSSADIVEKSGYAEELGPGHYGFKFWFKCSDCRAEFDFPEDVEDPPPLMFEQFLESYG